MNNFQGTRFISLGNPSGEETSQSGAAVFWGHGWGQSHAAFLDLCEPLKNLGHHRIVDFPGFGESDLPPAEWGTAEYADHVANLIHIETDKPIIWVGHSFGGRVGLQLAARHPELVKGLFLIAAAGLPRKRPFWKKAYLKGRIALYKFLKKLVPFGLPERWLIKTFASADYKSAGPMRQIFVKVVNEDLSDVATDIACPVTLVYGENDSETPPEIGERLAKLIPNAELIVLNNQDHYSVLGQGRHQVTRLLKSFIERLNTA